MNLKGIFAVSFMAVVGFASAQSISSFNLASFTGVTVNRVGNQISLIVGPNPTLTWNSVNYNITEVFAVYALDDNDDMAATGTNQNGWSFDTNFSGTGGIAGWKTNPNNGFVNDTKVFNYTTLTGGVEDFGFHFRVGGTFPGGGNTAYFRPVPEPASIAAISLGALGLLARRRRKVA